MELNNLKKVLTLDGFKNISNYINYITFDDFYGFRTFELSGDTLIDLKVHLNVNKILDTIYNEKVRFSENLAKVIDESDDYNLEETMEELGWNIVEIFNPALNKKWTHDLESELIYIVSISDINHIVVNNKVYAGEIDAITVLGSTPIKNIIEDTTLYQLLKRT